MTVTFLKLFCQRLKIILDPSHDTNLEIDKIELISFDKFTKTYEKRNF